MLTARAANFSMSLSFLSVCCSTEQHALPRIHKRVFPLGNCECAVYLVFGTKLGNSSLLAGTTYHTYSNRRTGVKAAHVNLAVHLLEKIRYTYTCFREQNEELEHFPGLNMAGKIWHQMKKELFISTLKS